MAKKNINLSEEDISALRRMLFGESSNDEATMKMIAQTALNRLRSGRVKEFGGNMQKVLQKGYYAVRNPNQPYKQALSGIFNDDASKSRWGLTQKVISDILKKQDFGNAMFYFTDDEIPRVQKQGFNFKAVMPAGKVGIYQTFGYPQPVSHYTKE